MVEYTVQKRIYEMSELVLNAWLAVAEDASRFSVPLSLRGLIRVAVKGQKEAIQFALDSFHRLLADPDNKKLLCLKPQTRRTSLIFRG